MFSNLGVATILRVIFKFLVIEFVSYKTMKAPSSDLMLQMVLSPIFKIFIKSSVVVNETPELLVQINLHCDVMFLVSVSQAQLEAQRCTQDFQRATEVLRAAKETISLAEHRLLEENYRQFDSAWQEMLNHATQRVREILVAKET